MYDNVDEDEDEDAADAADDDDDDDDDDEEDADDNDEEDDDDGGGGGVFYWEYWAFFGAPWASHHTHKIGWSTHDGSVCMPLIWIHIYHQYTPVLLAYIYIPYMDPMGQNEHLTGANTQ